MATFTHTIPVDVSMTQLWTLVRDVQRVANLFPYTVVEEMHTPTPESWRFWRQLSIPNVADLRWHEEARVVREGELAFTALEGDLQTFTGSWLVDAQGRGATLTLNLTYEIPTGLKPSMPAPLIAYVMGEIFKSICTRIKDAAEGREA